MTAATHLRRQAISWLFATLAIVPLAAGMGAVMGERLALADLATAGEIRAQLYRAHLIHELQRPADLLLALSRDPLAEATLAGDQASASRFDALLAELATAADLSDIYLMDGTGRTVAASNVGRPDNFVGHNFGFRRYFTQAMTGATGREFALGAASSIPGYYVAQPVRVAGQVTGTVVAKVALARLEGLAAGVPERLLVSDHRGLVLISDFPDLRFQPLPPEQPGHRLLVPTHGRRLPELITTVDLPWEGWRLHVLQPLDLTAQRATEWGALGGSTAMVMMLLGYSLWMRRQDSQALARMQRQARDGLEAELKTRTAELVQAAKLATIGQMAAGLVHEINQPLAALRAYAGNTIRFVELGRLGLSRSD